MENRLGLNYEIGQVKIGEREVMTKKLSELLTDNQNTLSQYNLEPRYDERLSLLYFTNPNIDADPENLRLIDLRNVRQPVFDNKGGFIEETVIDSLKCAGIFIPDTNKIAQEIQEELGQALPNDELRKKVKERVYQQANALKRKLTQLLQKSHPNMLIDPNSINIAVAIAGQLGLWEKLGFFEEIKPNIEGAPSLLEIINALFYNPNGSLSDLRVRFRTSGIAVPGIDILFYARDENGLAHPAGVTISGFAKNLKTTTLYENVVGLVAVPNEMPLTERKKLSRQLARLLGYWLKDPSVNVLTVDNNLIKVWMETGAIPTDEKPTQPIRRRIDYGFRPTETPTEANILMFEPKLMVGGPQLIIDVKIPSNETNISSALIVDWGLPYVDEALMTLANKPSFIHGLNPFLRTGMLPEVRRLYRTDLLIQSLTPQMIDVVLNGQYSFIVGEVSHRIGQEALIELIGERFPNLLSSQQQKELREKLPIIEKIYYSDKRIFEEVLISHGHTDHFGGLFSIRYDIAAGMSPETWAFLQTRFHQPGSWMDEHIIRRVRENGPQNPYPTEHRPIHFYSGNVREKISSNFSVLALPLNHSILGTLGFCIAITDSYGNPLKQIAYLTDFRDGPLTQKTIQILKEIGPEVLIIEGTNIQEKKISASITETTVQQNIAKYRKIADQLSPGFLIIQLPSNHLERLNNIIEVAGQRKVTVPLSIAQILHEFSILNENLPPEKQIPIPKIGTDIIVYYQPKMKYDPWEKQLIEQYKASDVFSLTSQPNDFIIIASPYTLLENIFSGQLIKSEKIQGFVINSSYWPYDPSIKATVISNYRFSQSYNLQYLSNIDLSRGQIHHPTPKNIIGLHASGHANDEFLLEIINQMAQTGKLEIILPIHTEFRGKYAQEIIKQLIKQGVSIYPEINGIRIIGRIRKKIATIPISLK